MILKISLNSDTFSLNKRRKSLPIMRSHQNPKQYTRLTHSELNIDLSTLHTFDDQPNLWMSLIHQAKVVPNLQIFFFFKNGRKIEFLKKSWKIHFWQKCVLFGQISIFLTLVYLDSTNWFNNKNIVLYEVMWGQFWKFWNF